MKWYENISCDFESRVCVNSWIGLFSRTNAQENKKLRICYDKEITKDLVDRLLRTQGAFALVAPLVSATLLSFAIYFSHSLAINR
jgi:hypothetical protein